MTVNLNLLSKCTTTNFQSKIYNERFGSNGEKLNLKTRDPCQQDIRIPTVSIDDSGGIIHIDNQPLGLKVPNLLNNTRVNNEN